LLGTTTVRMSGVYANELYFGGTDSKIALSNGEGSPNGVVRRDIGALYTDKLNGDLWRKTSGMNTTTGWVTP